MAVKIYKKESNVIIIPEIDFVKFTKDENFKIKFMRSIKAEKDNIENNIIISYEIEKEN